MFAARSLLLRLRIYAYTKSVLGGEGQAEKIRHVQVVGGEQPVDRQKNTFLYGVVPIGGLLDAPPYVTLINQASHSDGDVAKRDDKVADK
eukprot:CAMPEP_0170454690 /NCGR_PEP_ID=MMETSP0123-20130129/2853_1 /TAXON_ID=182087 /ORGANISM="Favella ehrenbergii, Strain Fehren 1" /LENGTH=89 /DNA_ID=CAMNT_0010717477 /DNA_START=914 /DNA_END=1182 /DNA_ORIENTATION=-